MYVFDSARDDMAFMRKSGQKYSVITSESDDSIFAVVNTSQQDPAQIEKYLLKLISTVVKESLGVETIETVIDFARKK